MSTSESRTLVFCLLGACLFLGGFTLLLGALLLFRTSDPPVTVAAAVASEVKVEPEPEPETKSPVGWLQQILQPDTLVTPSSKRPCCLKVFSGNSGYHALISKESVVLMGTDSNKGYVLAPDDISMIELYRQQIDEFPEHQTPQTTRLRPFTPGSYAYFDRNTLDDNGRYNFSINAPWGKDHAGYTILHVTDELVVLDRAQGLSQLVIPTSRIGSVSVR